MPRLRRSQLPDGIVHVTTRGVFERVIFLDDLDRLMFLALLVLVVRRHGWKLHAYCLMGTHYHLVVETSIDRLSEGMQYLNGVYAQRFNARHHRHGHVFGSRFASWIVRDDDHYERTLEYVLNNPVRAGLVDDRTTWRWSGAIGFRPTPAIGATTTLARTHVRRLDWPRCPQTPSSSTARASTTSRTSPSRCRGTRSSPSPAYRGPASPAWPSTRSTRRVRGGTSSRSPPTPASSSR